MNDDQVSVSAGWGKAWAKVGGTHVWTLVLVLVLVVVCVDAALSDSRHKERKTEHATGAGAVQTLSSKLDTLIAAQAETTYVLTLSNEDRAKLKLQMPDSMRKRLGRE